MTLRDLFDVSYRITRVDVTVRDHTSKFLKRYLFGSDINVTWYMNHDIVKGKLTVVDRKINHHGDRARGGSEIAWGVKLDVFPAEILNAPITFLDMNSYGQGSHVSVDVTGYQITVEAIDMGIEMIEKSKLETPCDLCRFNDDPDTSEEALKLICAKWPAESVKLCK